MSTDRTFFGTGTAPSRLIRQLPSVLRRNAITTMGMVFVPGNGERERKAAAHCDASRRERPDNETPGPVPPARAMRTATETPQ